MTWLASVLPGVREIRGPLVAGYLWMLNVWLLLSQAPLEDGSLSHGRLHELTDALGSVGIAAAASLVAYLVGSLSVNLFELAIPSLNRIRLYLHYTGRELEEGKHLELESSRDPEPTNRSWHPLRMLLTFSRFGGEITAGVRLPGSTDRILEESLSALTQQELGSSRAELASVIEREERGSYINAPSFQYLTQHGEPVARIPLKHGSKFLTEQARVGTEPSADLEIPSFSPGRDLFEAFPFLRARLAELAPIPSSKIERLFAEADFRVAIAPPLLLLAMILTAKAHGAWVISFVLPLALLVQAYSLKRNGHRELVDALRARSLTQELEQITPAFARFRDQVTHLIEAIEEAEWRPIPDPEEERLSTRFRRVAEAKESVS